MTIRWFGPPLVWCAVIFWLSHQPDLPATPGGDKTAHLIAYGILGLLFARAFWFGTEWRAPLLFVWAAAITALYGASDELHQSYVPGRTPSWEDLLADAIGACAGVLAFHLLARFTTWVRRDTGEKWSEPPRSRSS